jgi:hypothetical protein
MTVLQILNFNINLAWKYNKFPRWVGSQGIRSFSS